MTYRIIQGDVTERLRDLPDESVHCVVTSPPYYGLRDYGTAQWEGGEAECSHRNHHGEQGKDGDRADRNFTGAQNFYRGECGKCGATRADQQIGMEASPAEYVEKMTRVFREIRRVLRKDGTAWVNMGDSYAGSWGSQGHFVDGEIVTRASIGWDRAKAASVRKRSKTGSVAGTGLKPKDLMGIPWRLAFALQDDGWVLRQEIIWNKPNPMPESVGDRCTKAHESIFLLAKATWSGAEPRRFSGITDENARWLALFLDTEGNICAKRAKSSGGVDHFGAQICFASTARPLLDEAQRIIDAGTVLTRRGKNAPMYYLQLSNKQAADLLHRIYPFLIVKPRQGRLAIHLQDVISTSGKERRSKEGKTRGRMRADEYTEELVKIWATMKSLNHFGSPDMSWVPEPSIGRWSGCERYYYDADSIKEPCSGNAHSRGSGVNPKAVTGWANGVDSHNPVSRGPRSKQNPSFSATVKDLVDDRNKRSVWTVATQAYTEAHFATFPEELILPCILAGCPQGGTVLDPFSGSGTTGVVALRYNRQYIGIELSEEYCAMQERRISGDAPLFNKAEVGA